MVRSSTTVFIFVVSTLLYFQLVYSNSGCPCKYTVSSEDVITNHILSGHVIFSANVDDIGQCFHMCILDNRCKSFNIGKKDKGWLCELNESNKVISPLQGRKEMNYYEVNKRQSDEPSYFKDCSCSHYTESNCGCVDGYVGNYCHVKAYSCLDHLRYMRTLRSGIYVIFDDKGTSFPVYCDMDTGTMSAWTLVLSYALKFNKFFKTTPFYLDVTSNQSSPNWKMYRLSLARMKSIRKSSRYWRISCNYDSIGINKRDYAVVEWSDIDLLALNGGGCRRFVYIDVRGSHCSNCTTWVHQGLSLSRMFLVAVAYGKDKGCDLSPAANSNLHEESFGYYSQINRNFSCTANAESTTQYWFGGTIE